MKQSKMDECQKYAEQYSTAVKVRSRVPCVRFHVQGDASTVLFRAFTGHSICIEKGKQRIFTVTYLLILQGNLSPVTTPVSFLLSLCHTHTQLAHTLMYTRRKCSSVICLFLLRLPLPSLLECSLQVLLEHPPLVWLRVPCEYCCSIHRSTDGVSLEILLEYPSMQILL